MRFSHTSLENKEESFKLGVHLGLFGFAVACGLYNLGTCLHSRKNVSAVIIYVGLAAYEVSQMNGHWSAMRDRLIQG